MVFCGSVAQFAKNFLWDAMMFISKPTPSDLSQGELAFRWSQHIWFDPVTVWLGEPRGRRGRSAAFSDAAIQACLTVKPLFGVPLRQAPGWMASLPYSRTTT